jgi:hypothetical protein
MGTIDRSLRRIFDEERDAAEAASGVLAAVTERATRRRAGRLAGATVVALGIAGLAATTAISLGHRAAPAVPPETVLGTVTLPFDSTNAPVGNLAPLGLACGDPAPTPVTKSEGLEFDARKTPGELFSGAGVTTILRSTGGDIVPASVSPLEFIVVRDGVVAGWTDAGNWPDYRHVGPDLLNSIRGNFYPDGFICPGLESNGAFAPGDYEAFPVIHVSASPEVAARQWLTLQGFSVPSDEVEGLSVLLPGSWDCRTLLESSGPDAGTSLPPGFPGASALCAPPTLAGVTVDRDAKTITLPYTSRLYARSLDVTLVDEPYAFTQMAPRNNPGFVGFDMTPAEPVGDTSELTCGAHLDDGANFATGRMSVAVEQSALEQPARSPFADGTTLRIAAVTPSLAPAATVTYPAPLRVWFLANTPEAPDQPTKLRGPGYTVVGTGTAIVNGGAPLALDRFRGPSITNVTFAALNWCPSSKSLATTVVAFEGVERAGGGAGTETQSTVFDFWSATLSNWLTLGGTN